MIPYAVLRGKSADAEKFLEKYRIPYIMEEAEGEPVLVIGGRPLFSGLEQIADEKAVKAAYEKAMLLSEAARSHPYVDPSDL